MKNNMHKLSHYFFIFFLLGTSHCCFSMEGTVTLKKNEPLIASELDYKIFNYYMKLLPAEIKEKIYGYFSSEDKRLKYLSAKYPISGFDLYIGKKLVTSEKSNNPIKRISNYRENKNLHKTANEVISNIIQNYTEENLNTLTTKEHIFLQQYLPNYIKENKNRLCKSSKEAKNSEDFQLTQRTAQLAILANVKPQNIVIKMILENLITSKDNEWYVLPFLKKLSQSQYSYLNSNIDDFAKYLIKDKRLLIGNFVEKKDNIIYFLTSIFFSMAILGNKYNAVKLFLNSGVHPNLFVPYKDNYEEIFAHVKTKKIAQLFINHEVNLNKNPHGITIIHRILDADYDPALIPLYVQHGARANAYLHKNFDNYSLRYTLLHNINRNKKYPYDIACKQIDELLKLDQLELSPKDKNILNEKRKELLNGNNVENN